MDIKTMIAYVQIYIHIRKNVEVNINIRDNRDVFLLQKAYNDAVNWMDQNNFTLLVSF